MSRRLLLFLSISISALLFAAATELPVIQDEAYYWTWSRQLALGYFDHPPGVAFVLRATTHFFGNGLFGLRLGSLLAMALVVGATFAAARRLGGRQAGDLSLLGLAACPMFMVGCLPATPDPFLAATTASAAYLAVRALEEDASPWWSFWCALVLTSAGIFKHYAVFVAVGAFAGLFLSNAGRRLLWRPHPWLGLLLGLLLLMPWLAFEAQRDGGSILFQARRVLGSPTRGFVSLPLFVGSLAALGPFSLVVIVFGTRLLARRERAHESVLASGTLLLFLACAAAAWLGSGEANWPLPALLFFLPLAAARLLKHPRALRTVRGLSWVSAAALVGFLGHTVEPYWPLPSPLDPSQRGAGYATIAKKAEALARGTEATALAATRYQTASLLRYHTQDRIPVIVLRSLRDRLSQYDLWPRPKIDEADPIILVSRRSPSSLLISQVGSIQAPPITVTRWPEMPVGARDQLWITPVRLEGRSRRGFLSQVD